MKLSDLLEELDVLGLEPNQYVITSSGCLAVHNLREANDLDIVISDDLWKKFAQQFGVTQKDNDQNIQIGNLELFNSKSLLGSFVPFETQLKTAEVIQGHNYLNLELLVQLKQLLGREKDIQDIKLIKDHHR